MACLTLVAIVANAQEAPKPQATAEEKAKWPLPPDLVHFRSGSCTLFKIVKGEALNAKTGKVEATSFAWLVQPSATYDDKRDNWVYEGGKKDSKAVPANIGERVSGHDAWDLCTEWIDFAKAAADTEKAKEGK